jgi:RNA polymerase sigma-70 factor (ECF subfamily)
MKLTYSEQRVLVRGVLEGSQDAARALYSVLLPTVKSAVFSMSNGDLDEFVQVAMIKIFARLAEYRGESLLTTWASSVARREALQTIRGRRPKYEFLPLADNLVSPSREYDRLDLQRLRTKIEDLPTKQREIMRLRLWGLTVKEIAGGQHITVGTVKSQLYHAKLNLKKMVLSA